jgi:hypothetical protein
VAELRKRDRRKGRRVTEPFSFLVFWSGKSGRHHADMYDLSADGCYLNTTGAAEAGEAISVEVPARIALGGIARIRGTVIPQQRKLVGFGVRFAGLTPEQQAVVTGLLARSIEAADRRARTPRA